MVTTDELIKTITRLVKASEDILYPLSEDESRAEMYEEELDEIEAAANYARGVLLAAGHPINE